MKAISPAVIFGTAWGGALLCCAGLVVAQDETPIPHVAVNIDGHTAPVRAVAFSRDGQYLYTAGMDKVVQAWRLPGAPGARRGVLVEEVADHAWSLTRTIRWEVGRGLRGCIYAMAASPAGDRLAIAGYGNRGATGEIAFFRAEDGRLERLVYHDPQAQRRGHRESVASLAFSASAQHLASLDITGEAFLWRMGEDRPVVLCAPDRETYGPDVARYLAGTLVRRPLAIAADRWVIVPRYATQASETVATWILERYALSDGKPAGSLPIRHRQGVHALAASLDGRRLASSDGEGNLWVHDVADGDRLLGEYRLSKPVISLAFDPRGEILAIGTKLVDGTSELQWLEVGAKKLQPQRRLDGDVYACAISPDGRRLACASGSDVLVEWLDGTQDTLTIAGGKRIEEVSPARNGRGYQVVFKHPARHGTAARWRSFDPASLRLTEADGAGASPIDAAGWTAQVDRAGNRVQLALGSAPRGYVQLDRETQGTVQCTAWIPDASRRPVALAVGTDVQNGVFVYEMAPAGPCRMLRYFRGHSGPVTSVAASTDGRYLISGSHDGTLRYWSLNSLAQGLTTFGRWGGEMTAQGGALVVASLDELGPLFGRGVRVGDAIDQIQWVDAQGVHTETRPQEILRQLVATAWHTQVAFFTRRLGTARMPFQLRGGWSPLLSVYGTDRDWIAWTPGGYYACSAGGERLIGWQINREPIGTAPSFYTATQFHEKFYRPDLIRGLLGQGSVAASLPTPEEKPATVVEALPPSVRITEPGQLVLKQQELQLRVTAVAEARDGHPLLGMRLILDGVPYEPLSATRNMFREPGRKERTWIVYLTPGREHAIQVVADSDVSQGISETLKVTCLDPHETRPSLYILAIGISDYPEDLRLAFGRNDAEKTAAVLRSHGSTIFEEVEMRLVMDQNATRQGILDGFAWLKERLSRRRDPQNVGVIFFAGHGIHDEKNRFFLVPVGGSAKSVSETCFSDRLIKQFREDAPPCRLVLFLDACHSGAAKVFDAERINRAQNELGVELARIDYGVILISACRGGEVSLENPLWGGGAFTSALVDGLKGKARFVEQKTVSVPALFDYVHRRVQQLTNYQQTPTINVQSAHDAYLSFDLTSAGDENEAR